jgi:hypothetical protein
MRRLKGLGLHTARQNGTHRAPISISTTLQPHDGSTVPVARDRQWRESCQKPWSEEWLMVVMH